MLTDKPQHDTKKLAGLSLMLGAALINVPYLALIKTFDYPQLLRQPAAQILTQLHAGGDALTMWWLAFAWLGAPMLIGVASLPDALPAKAARWAALAKPFGLAALLFQLIGLLRWSFVNPWLAEQYLSADPQSPRAEAILVGFELVHRYAGVVLGEHLGMALSALWMGMVGFGLLRSGAARGLGAAGVGLSLIYMLAQAELLHQIWPALPYWEPAGLLGSVGWLGFSFVLGVKLWRERVTTATPQRTAAPKLISAGLLILGCTLSMATLEAQEKPERELIIHGFRAPVTGIEAREDSLGFFLGAYPIILSGEDTTTWFAKFGLAWYSPGFTLGSTRESNFYVGLSLLQGLSGDYKVTQSVDRGTFFAAEGGFRWATINGLDVRLGVIFLANTQGKTSFNPTPGLSWSIPIQ